MYEIIVNVEVYKFGEVAYTATEQAFGHLGKMSNSSQKIDVRD
jgi:hypothetical protein